MTWTYFPDMSKKRHFLDTSCKRVHAVDMSMIVIYPWGSELPRQANVEIAVVAHKGQ